MSSVPADRPPLIGALMRMPVEAVHHRVLAELHDAGFTDIVGAHLAVLRYPGPDDRRPSDLAVETGMTKQAMNYLLGQLEQAGYLARVDDPDDGRSKRIRLTARGEAVRSTARASITAIEAELERELGAKQFAQLRRLLIALNGCSLVRQAAARRA